MKTTKPLAAILATAFLAGSAVAGDSLKETAVLASLKQKYPQTQFKSIAETKLPGVYEVVMGKNVAYVEESGRYFLFGHLFDMQTQTDLTEGKVISDAAPRVDFSSLPIKDAVTIVRGDGSRKVAVFSDPDCPYCKQLENNLADLTNVTIYLFLFPIDQLHPEAKAKTVSVWCSKDRIATWDAMMRKNLKPAPANCDNPVERNIALAESLGINGTPTVILADGTVIPGAIARAKLEQLLSNQVKAAAAK